MTKTRILKRKLLAERVKSDILKNLREENVLTFFSKCANIKNEGRKKCVRE